MDEMEKEKMLTPNPLIEGKPKMTPLPRRMIMNHFTYLAYYLVAAEETRRSMCDMAGDDLEIVRKVATKCVLHYSALVLIPIRGRQFLTCTRLCFFFCCYCTCTLQVKGCPHITASIEAEEKRQRDEKARVKVLTLNPTLVKEVLRCVWD
jgi:hypothetical protein